MLTTIIARHTGNYFIWYSLFDYYTFFVSSNHSLDFKKSKKMFVENSEFNLCNCSSLMYFHRELPNEIKAALQLARHESVESFAQNMREAAMVSGKMFPNSSSGNSNSNLPDGWEMRTTPEGKVYYVNHITKTTQWDRPTI